MISDDIEEQVKNFRTAAMNGNWMEVLIMYNKRELREEKIAPTGDTVLHMAASRGELRVVCRMVRTLKDGQKRINEQGAAEENGDEKKRVLEAKNEKGNTPLHLAASASKWSFEMCEILGEEDPSLITIRNINGETPLFKAALHGNKEAFLWLHYKIPDRGPSTYYRNHGNDTILHCAIAGGHIDLAIKIVHLYEDHLEEMAKKKNENGLRPLHLLAATPSAFESTDLSGQSFLVQLLYHWFFRVPKKEQATTIEELEPHEREPFIETFMVLCTRFYDDHCEETCPGPPVIIAYLMRFLGLFLLAPIIVCEYLFSRAESLFRGIRKLNEKYTRSLQLMEGLFKFDSDMEDVTVRPYACAREAEGSHIVDTPLMVAAQNGVTEMVEKILELFPSAITAVNEEGKNIVLLAVEKRQTNLYRFLCRYTDINVFRQVDKHGNTALHLAAKVGVNLNWRATTLVQQLKWFKFVKSSVPSELLEKHNNDGETAEEILTAVFEVKKTKEREWLNQTSQACSVVSTVVASMAFSSVTNDSYAKAHLSSLVSLSMSLASTIILLTIVSVSPFLEFWIYLPFMLHAAISLMLGSIASLWISLMGRYDKSLTFYAILGLFAILTMVSTRIINHTLISTFAKFPAPNRSATSAIRYRKPRNKEDGKDSLQDIASSRGRARIKRTHTF